MKRALEARLLEAEILQTNSLQTTEQTRQSLQWSVLSSPPHQAKVYIYGKNSYMVVLTKFEHCVAHWYLRQYFKRKKDKASYHKMDLAFMSLYGQCGYRLGNIKHSRLFNHRMSILEKNLSIVLSERLSTIHSTTKQLPAKHRIAKRVQNGTCGFS